MSEKPTETIKKSDRKTWQFTNASLISFAHEIYVKCPKCGQAAMIKADFKYFNSIEKARVQCLSCVFYEDWSSEKLYGGVIGRSGCEHGLPAGRRAALSPGTPWHSW
jgi:hypothetical protein